MLICLMLQISCFKFSVTTCSNLKQQISNIKQILTYIYIHFMDHFTLLFMLIFLSNIHAVCRSDVARFKPESSQNDR